MSGGEDQEGTADTDGNGTDSQLDLWSRACDGDRRAKEQIARIVSEVARSRSRRRHLSPADTEEVEARMQLSILKLMDCKQSTPTKNLRGWLRFRSLSVTKEYFRELKKVQAMAPLLDDGDGYSDSQVGLSIVVETREACRALDLCLEQLPEPQRRAILDRYRDNQTVVQAAAAPGSPNPNTIRVWIHRAVISLRACLEKKGVTA